MVDEEVIKLYIHLSLIPGLGPVSQNALLNLAGSVEGCFELLEEELMRRYRETDRKLQPERIRMLTVARGSETLRKEASEIYERCLKADISVITSQHEQYPERFRSAPGIPVLLYIIGDLKINSYSRSVGIVGARRCSSEAKQKAIELTTAMASEGIAIVSGLAKGIDSYAHTAAIKSGGYTIAVMGSGPEICYPKEHAALYERICAEGCILSEYRPGIPLRRFHFPERNRLIAALSDELIVAEAGRNSGTDSTVQAFERFGREVQYL